MTQRTDKSKIAGPELVVSDGPELKAQPGAQLAALTPDEFMALLENASADELIQLAGEPQPHPGTQKKKPFFRELVHVPEGERTMAASLIWWEGRRIVFNAVVGFAGFPIACLLFMVGMPIWALIFGVVCYGIAANICYTLGYGAEVVAAKVFGEERAKRLAPELLVLGLIFSVLTTLLGGAAVLVLTMGGL